MNSNVVESVMPFLAVIAMAAAVEGVVEYFVGQPLERFAPTWRWSLMYVALLVSGIGVWTYQLDVFFLWLGFDGPTPFGMGMTMAIIARGSNYINDFVGKYLSRS